MSKYSVSPAASSTVSQVSLFGLQVPSPVAFASEDTRNTAFSLSLSTPRNTKNGFSADGSGVSRATSSSSRL